MKPSSRKKSSAKLKICLVTPEYPQKTPMPGGIGTYTADFAEGFKKEGHEVHVLIFGTPQDKESVENGIHFHEIAFNYPKWFDVEWFADRFPLKEFYRILKGSQAIKKIVRRHGIHIVEACPYQSLPLMYLMEKKRVPVLTRVTTMLEMTLKVRLNEFSKKQKLLFWLEKEVIRRSDALAVPTADHLDEVSRMNSLAKTRFEVIPFGVKVPEVCGTSPENERIEIITVGRLEPRKGTDVLLKAIPKVLEVFPQASFTFLGIDHKNKYEQRFRKETADAFSRSVRFMGKVSDAELENAYRTCDFLVVPSHYESFGLIYLEANSYGKPSIGGNAGGTRETIEDGKSGFLVMPGSVEDLTEKILMLVRDRGLREKMGAYGRRRVEKLFTKDLMVKRVLSQYFRVLGVEAQDLLGDEESQKNFSLEAQTCAVS